MEISCYNKSELNYPESFNKICLSVVGMKHVSEWADISSMLHVQFVHFVQRKNK
jgi:hypothetical protein